ncbi:MAG: undecaprenyl/decaprenyl-phosphate alpha-N-acetylglucosaminyl 1-phosphate transferase [Gammaproteobacteria bacterium]|nr:undecaprenyl/decaprenyl-phosphate alpha-N-acetylglucosaminyl 1-phosphate transferase [Gammaproteobacteria bacterium]
MLILGCLVGVTVTVVCIRALYPLAGRLNLVDYPGGRKQHAQAKPLIGGLALFIGFTAAMLSLPISLIGYRPFASAGLLLVLMGVFDDMHELSPRARLAGEIVAGLIMTLLGGVSLYHLGNLFFTGDLTLGWFAVPFTIFATVGLINAVNMLDGSDGLAGTLAFVHLGLLVILAWQAHSFVQVRVFLLLMSAVLGFLLYNFPFFKDRPARLFMGDAGSMFLGYALSWFSISLSQLPNGVICSVSILWVLGLTLWDAFRVIIVRLLAGRSPFKPDRNHLHHLLQEAGVMPREICLLMGATSVILGGIGIVGQRMGLSSATLLITYLGGFCFYCFLVHFFLGRDSSVDQEMA